MQRKVGVEIFNFHLVCKNIVNLIRRIVARGFKLEIFNFTLDVRNAYRISLCLNHTGILNYARC